MVYKTQLLLSLRAQKAQCYVGQKKVIRWAGVADLLVPTTIGTAMRFGCFAQLSDVLSGVCVESSPLDVGVFNCFGTQVP